jgi:hypothetical protein
MTPKDGTTIGFRPLGSSPARPTLRAVQAFTGRPNQSVVGRGPQQRVRDASALKTEFVCGTPQKLDGRIRVHDDSAAQPAPYPPQGPGLSRAGLTRSRGGRRA